VAVVFAIAQAVRQQDQRLLIGGGVTGCSGCHCLMLYQIFPGAAVQPQVHAF